MSARVAGRSLAAVALLLGAAGCFGAGRAATPAPSGEQDKRIVLDGFSVVPPRGPDWTVAPSAAAEENQVIVFGKRLRERPPATAAEARSAAAMALVLDFRDRGPRTAEDLQRWSERAAAELPPRQRLVASTSEPDSTVPDATCVRYAVTTEERGVTQFPDAVFVSTTRGLRCLHPRWPRYAVDLAQSQRYLSGLAPLPLDDELRGFMQGLRFTPARPLAASVVVLGDDPAGIAAGGGGVWVSQMKTGVVTRVDPVTNDPTGAPIAVGRQPAGIALGHGSVWVANRGSNTVSRIDAATGAVVAEIAVGVEPRYVAAGPSAVWVTNYRGGTVSRIDPASNATVARIVVGREPNGIAEGAGGVWVAVSGDGEVVRIDPERNSVSASVSVRGQPQDVAVGEGAVWVSDRGRGVVARIDPQMNQVAERITVGPIPSGVAVSGGMVWVASFASGSVWRIDPRTNTIVGRPLPVGRGPVWVTAGEGAVWIANRRSGTVARIDVQP
jgi:YVTN family beta-propeller protein